MLMSLRQELALWKVPGGIIIKKKLGLSDTQAIFTGAAPISISQLIWFQRLGINICQAYGLTEDCILSHFNLPGNNKFGSVGKPLGNIQIKFSPEDEILIKSECLMLGYYKEKQMTSEVFTEDGYLRTGDICEYDHDGYLWITGRIKDQFKTDKGKYISPAPIELEMLKNSDKLYESHAHCHSYQSIYKLIDSNQ